MCSKESVKTMSTSDIESRMSELDKQVFDEDQSREDRDSRLQEYRNLENELFARNSN